MLLIVVGVILAFLSIQLVTGAVAVGITVDEPTHVDRLQQWLDTGWYVPERFMADGAPDERRRSTPFVYGPAFGVMAHAANVVVGNETWDEMSSSRESHAIRHVVVALLSLSAAAAVGMSVQVATKSPIAGLWSATALLAIPAWTGHSMFNIKDVPIAVGYTLLTSGLIISLIRQGTARLTGRRQCGISILISTGVFLSVGTRTAMWVPITLSLIAFTVLSALIRDDRKVFARSIVWPILGFFTGLVAVFSLYPRTAATPVRWLIHSVADSTQYPWSGFALTAGQLLDGNPPAWYLPAWLGAKVPIMIMVVAVLGTAIIAIRIFRPHQTFSPIGGLSIPASAAPLLGLQQAILLPTGTVLTGSAVHSGLRHHLYILPALAILAGIGVAYSLRYVGATVSGRSQPVRRRTAVTVLTLLVLALAIPTVEQTQLYPYNYVYFNVAAGGEGINGRWETDYWGASGREALRRVPAGSDVRCSAWLVIPWEPERGPRIGQCGATHAPFLEEIGIDAKSAADDRIWVVGRVRGGNKPPPYCSQEDNVTRRLRGEEVLIGFVLACVIKVRGQIR